MRSSTHNGAIRLANIHLEYFLVLISTWVFPQIRNNIVILVLCKFRHN